MLSARDRATLREIEAATTASDPAFARLLREETPQTEPPRRRRRWWRRGRGARAS
ncbi:MAG: DUF3040 domain-containing protein [Sporichthyaceae bacterium]